METAFFALRLAALHSPNCWPPIEVECKKLVAQRRKTEGEASGEVSKKNVLKSLINLIKAHYPETYKSVLREFGFQKEGY